MSFHGSIAQFFVLLNSIQFMNVLQFVYHSPTEGHLNCIYILAIMSKTLINICAQVFERTYIFNIEGIHYWQRVGSLEVLSLIAIQLTTDYFTYMYQETL